jgi:drug/metabolite transporter (DMT)-like permease
MSASEMKHLPTDTTPWWEDREQLAFMCALFRTALFVFLAVSSAGDGYEHPPLIRVGAPLAAMIGFPTFVILGVRHCGKVRLRKVVVVVACMASLPVIVMQLFKVRWTPPNPHNGEAIAFFLYSVFSEFIAAVFLVAALIRRLRHN